MTVSYRCNGAMAIDQRNFDTSFLGSGHHCLRELSSYRHVRNDCDVPGSLNARPRHQQSDSLTQSASHSGYGARVTRIDDTTFGFCNYTEAFRDDNDVSQPSLRVDFDLGASGIAIKAAIVGLPNGPDFFKTTRIELSLERKAFSMLTIGMNLDPSSRR